MSVILCAATLSGCAQGPETSYGSARGGSINGTGAFAALLRHRGHEVRSAWRLSESLSAWADVIVRFASTPGPPDRDEAEWFGAWLEAKEDRSLIYVVRDYDSEAEYWSLVLDQLDDSAEAEPCAEAESRRSKAASWVSRLPSQTSHPADALAWFAIASAIEPPAVCKSLDGALAFGVDAERAGITVHAPLKRGEESSLLEGDGKTLAEEWEVQSGSRIMVIANASFLVNLALINPERRIMAGRVADWLGDPPLKVALVEGFSPIGDLESPPTLFDLIARIEGFRWAAIQLGLFGLLACLARAPTLGRPRPEPASDADRPAAHAEALGALLQRTRNPTAALEQVVRYRAWRSPRTARGTQPEPGIGTRSAPS